MEHSFHSSENVVNDQDDIIQTNEDSDEQKINKISNQLNLLYIPNEYYNISKCLGGGTFGDVFQSRFQEKEVAIKFMKYEDFLKEAEQLSRVEHENIIGIYGFTTGPCKYGLVLEFADGGNLYNFLHPNNSSPVPYILSHAISWCLQCARGVQYLHSLNIIHRDLKPLNLLLKNKCLDIKICDFGTAREKQTTMTGNQGTITWMAPEVFTSRKYSEKCDVYSWSIILWECLTREKPFRKFDNPIATMYAVHSKNVRPSMIRNCPPLLQRLITAGWDKDAAKRPSMRKVVRIMEIIFNECPIRSRKELEIDLPPFSSENIPIIITNVTNNNYPTFNKSLVNKVTKNIPIEPTSGNVKFCDDYKPFLLQKPVMVPGHKRSSSSDAALILDQESSNRNQIQVNFMPSSYRINNNNNNNNDNNNNAIDEDEEDLQNIIRNFPAYLFMPPHLSPMQPDVHTPESYRIFQEHKFKSLKLFKQKYESEVLKNRIQELNIKKRKKLNGNWTPEESGCDLIKLRNDNQEFLKTRALFTKLLKDSTTSCSGSSGFESNSHNRSNNSGGSSSNNSSGYLQLRHPPPRPPYMNLDNFQKCDDTNYNTLEPL